MLLKTKAQNKLKSIVGTTNVLTSKEERYCYSFDALNSREQGKLPDSVVFVEFQEQVQEVLKYANLKKIPIVARGAGSNMVGACLCLDSGIVLNFSKMNKILEFNKSDMTIRVQAGLVLADLMKFVESQGLYYPAYPSSYKIATVGGAIAQSSGGAMSLKYGTTKDYILSMKVVTAQGEILNLGCDTIKNSTGYHLAQLMIGSEGTLGVIVEATIKLIPKPEYKKVICAYFSDIESTVSAVNSILENKIIPAAIDFMDKNSIVTVENYSNCGLNMSADTMLIMELHGDRISVENQNKKIINILNSANAFEIQATDDNEAIAKIWGARQASYSATTRLAPDVISGDIIVPRKNLVEMIKRCREIYDKYNLKMCLVGHIGDGNLHPQIALNIDNDNQYKNYKNAQKELFDAVLKYEGTISAEHGIGVEKIDYIDTFISKEVLGYMKQIKKVFDPNNILNPHKIFKMNE